MKTWKSLLFLLLLSGDAWGTDYIKRYNSLGVQQTPVYTSTTDLSTAVNACSTGDSLELLAGASHFFTLSADTTCDIGTKNIEIRSTGYTCRVTAIDTTNHTLTLETDGESLSFASGLSYALSTGRVRFFGEGCSNLADRGNYIVKTWDADTKKMTLWNNDGTAIRDLTNNNLAERPLYAYYHAIIKPANTSQSYNQLLTIKDGNNLTLKNLTFTADAPLDGTSGTYNTNGTTSHGRLLKLQEQAGEVKVTGVQVMDCIKGSSAAQDASFGFWAVGEEDTTLTMEKSFTDNTDYHGLRVQNMENASITYCTFRNFKQRGLGLELASGQTMDTFDIDNCWFYCTPDAEGNTGPTTYLRVCMNLDPVAEVGAITISDTVLDLRDVEASGKSWDYTGIDSCPLMKVQNTDTFTATDCKFLHGGNDYDAASVCYSFKFDPGSGVENALFRRCDFSGGILCTASATSNKKLEFYGCTIMKDGNFNSTKAIDFCEYRYIVLNEDDITSSPTTIDKLSNSGTSGVIAVIDMYDTDWGSHPQTNPTPLLQCANLDVTIDGGSSSDAYMLYGRTNDNGTPTNSSDDNPTETPIKSHGQVSFHDASCVMLNSHSTGRFRWSFWNGTVQDGTYID